MIRALVAALLGLATTGADAARGAKAFELEVAGVHRTYRLFVPESLPANANPPLLLVLHGGGGNGRKMERFVGGSFHPLARRDGWLVAYPDALHHTWNDGRDDVTSASHREHVDDVGFLRTLIDRLASDRRVDPRRVYVAGISNGGMMACRLACELGDRVAAIAVIASSLPKALAPGCGPARPVSAVFLCGTADPLVPFDGGFVHIGRKKRGEVIGVRAAAARFARLAGCPDAPGPAEPVPDADPKDGCRAARETWAPGPSGARVELYTITGGGHTWPGGRAYLPAFIVGPVCRDLDGCAVVWDFFSPPGNPPRPGS